MGGHYGEEGKQSTGKWAEVQGEVAVHSTRATFRLAALPFQQTVPFFPRSLMRDCFYKTL